MAVISVFFILSCICWQLEERASERRRERGQATPPGPP
jgi:hypothetical protein